MARRAIVWILVLAGTFVAGFKVGVFFQHCKTCYVHEIRSERTYSSPYGAIRLEYATESIGVSFLDPGTSTIVLKEPSGQEVVLYKAQRGFQESSPFPEELVVTDDQIRWDDGLHVYSLRLEASQRRSQRGDPGNRSLDEGTPNRPVTPTQAHDKS